jgi:predicted AlkP superfamily phosphohydrolase/phosphomutase
MRLCRALLAILLTPATFACRASAPVTTPQPRADLHATARRVVLLSIDGLAATRHRHLLSQRAYREPAGLAAFEGWGYVVEHAVPVEPTLTAVNHASIATGALPGATGIVSNRFHLPGTPISRSVSGFDAPWSAEPLWQSFRRQGKRVGALTYPSCDGKTEARRVDFGAVWVDAALAAPQSVALDAAAFAAMAAPPGAPESLAPLRRAALPVVFAADSGVATVEFTVVAIDASDDGVAGYDTLLVDDDGDLGNGGYATVRAGEWFPLRTTAPHPDGGQRLVGAWCLLQEIAADLSQVRLYRGGFNATEAYPRAFRELLDREASFWPGAADDRALEKGVAGQGGLLIADYMAQTRRFAEFFSACARATIANERFDLLLAYQPIVDEVQHALTITDPRQVWYSEGMAATAARTVNETYLIADAAVADLALALDLSSDALVVVSDHGIAPIWETVHGNEVLRRAGLAESVERNGRQVAADTSKVVAMASGGCAHLYVNQIGREPSGVVPPERTADVVGAAARAFAMLELGGEPMVESAFVRGELAAIGLDTPNAGDLVVFMRPGINVTGGIGGAVHEPATYSGQHGFRNHHPEMHGVLMARGAAVPRARRAEASLTEVAALVSHLGGVQPPRDAGPWRR